MTTAAARDDAVAAAAAGGVRHRSRCARNSDCTCGGCTAI